MRNRVNRKVLMDFTQEFAFTISLWSLLISGFLLYAILRLEGERRRINPKPVLTETDSAQER